MHRHFPVYSIGHFIIQPDNPTAFEITKFEQMDEPNTATLAVFYFAGAVARVRRVEKGHFNRIS